jgi:phosphate transport system substrate-binding protein
MTTAPDRAKSRLGSAIRTAGPKRGRFASLGSWILAALVVVSLAVAANADESLRGSGSTFVAPFLTEAFAQYALSKRGPFSIGYRAVGSGAGIADFIARRVDFCATDVPMNSSEIGKADGSVLQIPIALGGIALTYNLPEAIPGNLHLTRELVANIFLGKVRSWNDPSIARENGSVALPDLPITVVHRSDSSGTTYIFSDFLRSVSPEWQRRVGVGKAIHRPAPRALGAGGNEGVARAVDRTPGALGYVELTYVEKSNLLAAWIKNRSGSWSFPDEQSIQAAALLNASGAALTCSPQTVGVAAATKPEISATDFSIVDRKGKEAWPISMLGPCSTPSRTIRHAHGSRMTSWNGR